MAEVLVSIEDEILKDNLLRHLLKEHLLVKELDPMNEVASRQSLRIANALKFLKLVELRDGSPEAVREIMMKLLRGYE
jgi:hypothetical protein